MLKIYAFSSKYNVKRKLLDNNKEYALPNGCQTSIYWFKVQPKVPSLARPYQAPTPKPNKLNSHNIQNIVTYNYHQPKTPLFTCNSTNAFTQVHVDANKCHN